LLGFHGGASSAASGEEGALQGAREDLLLDLLLLLLHLVDAVFGLLEAVDGEFAALLGGEVTRMLEAEQLLLGRLLALAEDHVLLIVGHLLPRHAHDHTLCLLMVHLSQLHQLLLAHILTTSAPVHHQQCTVGAHTRLELVHGSLRYAFPVFLLLLHEYLLLLFRMIRHRRAIVTVHALVKLHQLLLLLMLQE
jgi:hypothetical protein